MGRDKGRKGAGEGLERQRKGRDRGRMGEERVRVERDRDGGEIEEEMEGREGG